MDVQYACQELSDDEIFMGPLTIKEVKKRLHGENCRQTIGYSDNREPDQNTSLKIIETHSAPDIIRTDVESTIVEKSDSSPSFYGHLDWDIKPDDSFLRIEKMVSNLTVSPELENVQNESDTRSLLLDMCTSQSKLLNMDGKPKENSKTPAKIVNEAIGNKLAEKVTKLEFKTPLKSNISKIPVTPSDTETFVTPLNKMKSKMPVFKTPSNPPSHRKLLITPKKYQNIASPVATYIKKSPLVPLVKDVCLKKQLAGTSSIPKPVKHIPRPNTVNKENLKQEHLKKDEVHLPSIAYKNAKETKMIDIPDKERLPQNQWAKQVASAIPKAVVIKHNHREISSAKKCLHKQEDSFADLTMHQADVSVCTQKSAFKKIQKDL